MKPNTVIFLALIGAVAIIATAWFTKGTEHQNAWLYVLGAWSIISALLELYFKKKK